MARETKTTRQPSILVMGSDREIRATCDQWSHNHLVFTAEDLPDALSYLQSMQFDLVVVEYEFAAHSGPLLLEAARKGSPAARLVVVSSVGDDAAHLLVASGTADACLTKRNLGQALRKR